MYKDPFASQPSFVHAPASRKDSLVSMKSEQSNIVGIKKCVLESIVEMMA